MPQSELRLIKRCSEFIPQKDYRCLPRELRGIYVLYLCTKDRKKCDVVYVGMAKAGFQGGIRARLWAHQKRKADLWTHFSVFEVWENIRDEEVIELEGLFRHIYQRDSKANRLNVQRGFKKLRKMEKIPLDSRKGTD